MTMKMTLATCARRNKQKKKESRGQRMGNEVDAFTYEAMNQLKIENPIEWRKMKELRVKWLREQRKSDKRQQLAQDHKIYKFKNPEVIKRLKKKYYEQKNKVIDNG